MKFISVCSGIDAASVAWNPLGWEAVAFSEIEPFPCAVLAHHYPTVPNLGDLTRWRDWPVELLTQADVLIGGTPCQAFSVAGKRESMSDGRGQLSLCFWELADAIDNLRHAAGIGPCTVLWENVPGCLTTPDNAFGCILGAACGHRAALDAPRGGSWPDAGVVAGPVRTAAWRVLDAQHFGVAQRRRRIFLLARGGAGSWECADALLPLREGGSGNPPTRRGTRQDAAGGVAGGVGGDGEFLTAGALPSGGKTAGFATGQDAESGLLIPVVSGDFQVAHTLRGEGFDASEDGTSLQGVYLYNQTVTNDLHVTLRSSAEAAGSGALHGMAVRRLLPVECERLQGFFPDGYTQLPGRDADGPRYRALGNSMAVPVISWLGRQIAKARANGA